MKKRIYAWLMIITNADGHTSMIHVYNTLAHMYNNNNINNNNESVVTHNRNIIMTEWNDLWRCRLRRRCYLWPLGTTTVFLIYECLMKCMNTPGHWRRPQQLTCVNKCMFAHMYIYIYDAWEHLVLGQMYLWYKDSDFGFWIIIISSDRLAPHTHKRIYIYYITFNI